MEPLVLEEWLVAATEPLSSTLASALASPSVTKSPDFATTGVIQAWAQIRACVQQQKPLTQVDGAAFDLLSSHGRSLHVADAQAKLLLAVLTDVRGGEGEDPALLGKARRFAVLGLLGWIRKSFTGAAASIANSVKRQAPETVASIIQAVRKAMEERPVSDWYACEAVLLLGAACSLPFVSAAVRSEGLTSVAVVLDERRDVVCGGGIALALAGAGYALSVSSQEHLAPILRALFLLWTHPPHGFRLEKSDLHSTELSQPLASRHVSTLENSDLHSTDLNQPLASPHVSTPENSDVHSMEMNQSLASPQLSGEEKRWGGGFDHAEGPSLRGVMMLLHLMDYLGALFFPKLRSSQPGILSQIELVLNCVLGVVDDHNVISPVGCSAIMVCAGLLRSSYKWDEDNKRRGIPTQGLTEGHGIMANLEALVVRISEHAVTADPSMADTQQLLRCVSLAVSRCRGLPAHPCILHCLLVSILGDALNMKVIYPALTAVLVAARSGIGQQKEGTLLAERGGVLGSIFGGVQSHLEGYFFQQIGAVVRALCEHHIRTNEDLQEQTEIQISEFARSLYERHRVLVATFPKSLRDEVPQFGQILEKVLNTSFLTAVIFFSVSVKEYGAESLDGSQARRTALALDSLACMEYFRHVQLRQFSTLVQRCASYIYGSEVASVSIAQLLPAYQDINRRPGTLDSKLPYSWEQDEVQTARILFSFRVLPMCLAKMPEATFANEVAPLMFLYLQHPLETVSKAAHSLFAAFLSSSLRTELTTEVLDTKGSQTKSPSFGPEMRPAMTLREQLVVFYIQRALQVFPAVTPFQGLVAGVGAVARQLPSGSPATVYCMTALVDKAITLYHADLKVSNMKELERETPPKNASERIRDQDRKFAFEQVRAAQKLQILLLHLILLVDLQVLPALLKLVAKLILGLPQRFRTGALADAFDVVGGSEDYTRKPVLVPWLQSLSFLLFNVPAKPNDTEPLSNEDQSKTSVAPSSSTDLASDSEIVKQPIEIGSPAPSIEESEIEIALETESTSSSADLASDSEIVKQPIEIGSPAPGIEESWIETALETESRTPNSKTPEHNHLGSNSEIQNVVPSSESDLESSLDKTEEEDEQLRLDDQGLQPESKL